MERAFVDRDDAGRQLGAAVRKALADRDVLVLGLPRGGVPVAAAVAAALGAPLDVIVVRKVGVPGQPELAMGAVASGGTEVRSADVLGFLPGAAQQFAAVAAREREEVARRERVYRGARPPLELKGREVVLVDDGLATGSTMEAAVRACRAAGSARIVVAVPVAPPDTVARLKRLADQIICLETPAGFMAVGQWYDSFPQLEDEEVQEILAAQAVTKGDPTTMGSSQAVGRRGETS
jgi:predicted phosphoribosyltransferase